MIFDAEETATLDSGVNGLFLDSLSLVQVSGYQGHIVSYNGTNFVSS